MTKRTIRTRKADVYGDDISGMDVNRQTGNHEGQTRTVRKNVTIEYEKPRSWKKVQSLDDVPTLDTAIADIAVVNAKEIHGPWPVLFKGRKQKRIQAKRDVTITFDGLGDQRVGDLSITDITSITASS